MSFDRKKKHGSFETAIEKNKGVLLVRRMDNAVVTMASTDIGTENVSSVKSYSKKHKKYINVNCPKLIAKYNNIDTINIASFSIKVRGKKRWWPIFTRLLEIPMNNSWTLYKNLTLNKLPSWISAVK